MLQSFELCNCVGRAKPVERSETTYDYFDIYDAKKEDERMKEEWQWLSIRCERRLNEQLRFYQQQLAESCDAVQSHDETPAPCTEFVCYIPKLIRRFIRERLGSSGPEPRDIADTYAVTVFCDVSGFTALAEAIERSGDPQAAATLGCSLNSFFNPLICIINRWGGDIMKFSGDAVLVAWFVKGKENACDSTDEAEPNEPSQKDANTLEPDLDDAWRQCALALKCCEELHKTLHEYPTGVENKTLAMHIGVGFGKVAIVHVGGMMERWEFVIAGKPLEEIAVAEPLASKGQTVLSHSVYEIIQDEIKVTEIENHEGYFLFHEFMELVDVEPNEDPEESFDLPPESVPSFRTYMPSYIFFRLMSGYSVFNNEMRRLSTIFVSVPGLDVSSRGGRDMAQQLMSVCQRATYALEGSLNKFLVDDKGVVLLIFIGFPPVYHTDDPVRAVLVSLKIVNDCAKLGLSPGVGVTTGSVWCGTLGNSIRKEYTCLGDYVNLSARLMGKAAASSEHKIIVDEKTATEAGHFLKFEELEPVMLKGKEAATRIFTPTGKVNKFDSNALEGATPLETWKQWGTYKTVKGCLYDSQLLDHGGVVLIEGHVGCGTQDLRLAITSFIRKRGYNNCFSLSNISEDSPAISIANDENCAWRDLCNGLVSTWASSPSRKAMVTSYHHSKYLYGQSDHCVSKKVVGEVVKELLHPILHWRMGTLKPLVMGLEVEPLRNILGHRVTPSNHESVAAGIFHRWVGGEKDSDSDTGDESEDNEDNIAKTNVTVCNTTLLDQKIMKESIAPFVASMVHGFSTSEPICIILNIRRGSTIHAEMDDGSCETITELSKLSMERRRDRLSASTRSKPILFIVVTYPNNVFLSWYEELKKMANECTSYVKVPKLNKTQLADFIVHFFNLESNKTVPKELIDHVYQNTSGMAQFAYKTLENMVEAGAVVLEDVDDDCSSDSDNENAKPAMRLLRRSEILDIFDKPLMFSENNMYHRKDLGISLEQPTRRKKKLVSVNLAGVGSIDDITAFAMSVVDRLKPYELFVAKVACLLKEPLMRRDLLGENPHGFTDEQFDGLLRSLIVNEVLETESDISTSDQIGPEVQLRLCSNAMANVLLQRVLEEEREWFGKHFNLK
ncbi:adenylyl cyclase beta [Babesia gibsoni]|uniref:Adenylyl cyclase beta n=1 Tax=Babesia gibsoni TaxID=33632 RepID=A0AAD8P7S4_BABGI|nr:adenylyl cyclase beta [Babesia gibsoni]